MAQRYNKLLENTTLSVTCLLTRLAFPSVSIDRLTGVSEGYTSRLKSRLFKKLAGKEGNAKDFEHWIMAIK
jgi:hypothetical protein